MSGQNAQTLGDMVVHEMLARLEPHGWRPVDATPRGGFTLASWERPIGDEFEATAEIWKAGSSRHAPELRLGQLLIGVSYEPLRALWPLLGEQFSLAARSTVARGGREDRMIVTTPDEAAGAAETLASIVLERAVPFAQRRRSVDAIVAELADRESDVVPAILAAAGRPGEARAALATYLGRVQAGVSDSEDAFERIPRRRAERFARQLTRWLDSGCDSALIPAPLAPEQDSESSRRSMSELREAARAKRAAIDVVRGEKDTRSRAGLRTLLETELAARGLRESPLSIELILDDILSTPAQIRRHRVRGIVNLGRVGLTLARAVRDRELPIPGVSPPSWLDPPLRASYDLTMWRQTEWVAVALDPEAGDWLETILDAMPTLLDVPVGRTPAWVEPAPSPDDPGRLSVHLGERRVGILDGTDVAGLAEPLAAALFRDELPVLQGKLVRRPEPPGYLLQVAVPV
jgi:hypothetical protein